jgi:hypothetical protein
MININMANNKNKSKKRDARTSAPALNTKGKRHGCRGKIKTKSK